MTIDNEKISNLALCVAEWLAELAPHFYSKKELQDQASQKMPKVAGRSAIAAQ